MNPEDALGRVIDSVSSVPLSLPTKREIEKIAAELACINETYQMVLVDILRNALAVKLNKAFGRSIDDWTKVDKGLRRIKSAGSWKGFESKHIVPEVRRQRLKIRRKLEDHLLSRLSDHVRTMFTEIDSGDTGRPMLRGRLVFDETVRELQMIVALKDEAFQRYETERLVPELERHRVGLLQSRGILPQFRDGISVGGPSVANVKYKMVHFMEVDRLIRKGMRKRIALETVFERHFGNRGDHSLESFKKQYRVRHELLIIYDDSLYMKVDMLVSAGNTPKEALQKVFRVQIGVARTEQKIKDLMRAYKEYQRRRES